MSETNLQQTYYARYITGIHHTATVASPRNPTHPPPPPFSSRHTHPLLSRHPPTPNPDPRNVGRARKICASTNPIQKGRPRRAVKLKRLPNAPFYHTKYYNIPRIMCIRIPTSHRRLMHITYTLCPTPPDSPTIHHTSLSARGHSYSGKNTSRRLYLQYLDTVCCSAT